MPKYVWPALTIFCLWLQSNVLGCAGAKEPSTIIDHLDCILQVNWGEDPLLWKGSKGVVDVTEGRGDPIPVVEVCQCHQNASKKDIAVFCSTKERRERGVQDLSLPQHLNGNQHILCSLNLRKTVVWRKCKRMFLQNNGHLWRRGEVLFGRKVCTASVIVQYVYMHM